MALTDIQNTGEFMPTEVGSKIYVWSPGGKPPSQTGRTGCVISAHGRQALVSSFYRRKLPKGLTMHFYCPNGFNLQDPDLLRVVTGEIEPCDTTTSASARQDYVLSKYQGRHNKGGKETYKLIQQEIHPNHHIQRIESAAELKRHNYRSTLKNSPEKLKEAMEKVEQYELVELYKIRAVVYDVVTLRNRALGGDTTLFELLAALYAGGYGYTDIHCSFCRGPALGSGKGSWNAIEQRPGK